MKKVIVPFVREEAQYFCDKHHDKVCFSELKIISWWGSGYDLNGIEIHLCDRCLKEMYDLLYKKFKITRKEMEI